MFVLDTNVIVRALQEQCDAAYSKGYADGSAATRDAILKAASQAAPDLSAAGTAAPAKGPFGPVFEYMSAQRERAPRGAVTQAVARMLVEKPGMSVADIEQIARHRFPEISPKSFGNELRRFEGDRYKRDRDGGYKWFLIEQDVPGEEHGAGQRVVRHPPP